MKSRLPQEYAEKYRLKKTHKMPQMTLYDLNKQMVKQLPPMDADGKKNFIENIFNEFENKYDSHYFMLLCKELSYFTVFHKNEGNDKAFAEAVHELLSEKGTILTAGWDNEEDKNSLEYWVKVNIPIENNPDYIDIFCFYLFDYHNGIEEVQ